MANFPIARRLLLTLALVGAPLLAQSPTNVMATLTVNPAIDRSEMVKIMPAEVRATVNLYLDGKIQQWYSRGDNKGVIFILNCQSVEEAKAMLSGLPLVKAGFATFDYMPLMPLKPLRYLLQDQSAK